MNHTRRVVDMGRIVDHWNAIRVHNPDVEMTFGETNMWSDSHGQEALETVFGTALFYVDYCMFGMSQVRSSPTDSLVFALGSTELLGREYTNMLEIEYFSV